MMRDEPVFFLNYVQVEATAPNALPLDTALSTRYLQVIGYSEMESTKNNSRAN